MRRDGQFEEVSPEDLRAARRRWIPGIISGVLFVLSIPLLPGGLIFAVPFLVYAVVQGVYDRVTVYLARRRLEREYEKLLDRYRR